MHPQVHLHMKKISLEKKAHRFDIGFGGGGSGGGDILEEDPVNYN